MTTGANHAAQFLAMQLPKMRAMTIQELRITAMFVTGDSMFRISGSAGSTHHVVTASLPKTQ
jgi:hypothetical protein